MSSNGPTEELTCYFLHHAGGSAAGYMPLAQAFPPDWRLRAIDLPGRGTDYHQPHCRDAAEAVELLKPAFLAEASGPYAVFGHSMGALIGYELVRELERAGLPPVWLGVSAMPAPKLACARFSERRDLWSPEQLISFMRRLDGTPEEMLTDPDIAAWMVGILRGDLHLVDTYEYAEGPPVTVPMSVFMGVEDELSTPELIDDWQSYCTRPVRFHYLSGGHFYLFEQAESLARYMAEDIAKVGETAPL
ncbi:alpha/beta fold hydrolase [Streptomyces sp. NBC_01433]|uniref:thioesterase II family protein n=1 Tax=Streptomyces sp. NBC_01433 TaxID=2903864 RepID=UPI002254D060|nr:alpha/beta fold hydrolase [Streptomyces sp. NBC_01433]MCX4675329.1 alpha/beta fold hydrolase [Streptomyces sp. NBC_01433]